MCVEKGWGGGGKRETERHRDRNGLTDRMRETEPENKTDRQTNLSDRFTL